MKKFLLTVMLLLTSLASQAAWVLVSETNDGERMMAEKGSFKATLNSSKSLVLIAKFAITKKGDLGSPAWVAIDANSCAAGGGRVVYGKVDSTDPGSVAYWVVGGDRMFDDAAIFLCEVWKASLAVKSSGPSV